MDESDLRKKRIFYGLILLVGLLFLGAQFLPLFSIPVSESGTTTYHFSGIIDFYRNTDLAAIIVSALGYLLLGVGFVLGIIATRAIPKKEGDRADAFFVYSQAVIALAAVALAITFVSVAQYVAMAVFIVESLLSFLFIFCHYKFFTYY
jgi:hypothetical protein